MWGHRRASHGFTGIRTPGNAKMRPRRPSAEILVRVRTNCAPPAAHPSRLPDVVIPMETPPASTPPETPAAAPPDRMAVAIFLNTQ